MVLDALGDPTRRSIFERLGRGPAPVGELAAELPVSRPAVSQHLKVLKRAGLVADRAVGTRRIYEVQPAGLVAVRQYFEQFWTDQLAAFSAAASRSSDHEPSRRPRPAATDAEEP
jgi:DNA-binding transcriptional ArsR family regulator